MSAMRSIFVSVFLSLFVLFGSDAIAQKKDKYKYDEKTEMVSKNGSDYAKVTRRGCGFNAECIMSVFDAAGEKAIIVSMHSYVDPAAKSSSNPKGNVYYAEYLFPKLEKRAEYNMVRNKPDKLMKDIDKNGLMKDGKLDQAAAEEFVMIHGMKFSQERDRIIKVITN